MNTHNTVLRLNLWLIGAGSVFFLLMWLLPPDWAGLAFGGWLLSLAALVIVNVIDISVDGVRFVRQRWRPHG